jgi:hypothetical protein
MEGARQETTQRGEAEDQADLEKQFADGWASSVLRTVREMRTLPRIAPSKR